ncbi:MAG: site-2 protease family protein [Prevotella sp.]|nr:site-2 protease family protein [Prevotella sp.]
MEVFLIRLLQFLMAISLLVLLHELGHFTFAKLFKVRVTKFYLFFNLKFHIMSTYDTWVRRLLKLKPEVVPTKEVEEEAKEGEEPKKKTVKEYVGTEYGLGWLPLGGYCAIDGMIDETNQQLSQETHPWEFRTKPTWQRLLIMIGGVLVNFLLALFIYSMILFTWGETYVPVEKMTHGMEFNSEAKALGFQDGDVLVSTDRGPLKKWDDDLFREVSKAKQVNVLRDGQQVTVHIPESADLNLLNMFKATPMFMRVWMPAVADSVIPGTAAAQIGMMPGDTIVGINGRTVASYNQFQDEIARLRDVLTAQPADSMKVRQVEIVLKRVASATAPLSSPEGDTSVLQSDEASTGAVGVTDTLAVTLSPDLKLGFFPVQLYEPTTFKYGFFESIPAGIGYGWHKLCSYVSDMQYVFTSEGAKSLGGFGAIGSLFPEVWDWHRFWEMTAFLSIILAFMNILPIPALDGGHVLFLLYEMITGRKPSEKFMIRAEYVGFGILILLMVVANLNDILRWLGYM